MDDAKKWRAHITSAFTGPAEKKKIYIVLAIVQHQEWPHFGTCFAVIAHDWADNRNSTSTDNAAPKGGSGTLTKLVATGNHRVISSRKKQATQEATLNLGSFHYVSLEIKKKIPHSPCERSLAIRRLLCRFYNQLRHGRPARGWGWLTGNWIRLSWAR